MTCRFLRRRHRSSDAIVRLVVPLGNASIPEAVLLARVHFGFNTPLELRCIPQRCEVVRHAANRIGGAGLPVGLQRRLAPRVGQEAI